MSIDNATPEEWDQAIDMLAINNQVGGQHYTSLKIQPKVYAYANNLSPCLADVVKYITRKKDDRVTDLLKAKQSIDLELQLVHGVDGEGNKIGRHTLEVEV
jgi:hypothetical protein